MRLGKRFVEKLDYLSESEELPRQLEKPLLVSMQKAPATVQVTVLDFGRLGCSIAELGVDTKLDDDRSLAKMAQAISERLSYLPEQVEVIEQAPELGEVQLRSAPPHTSDVGVAYYEGVLRRDDDSRVAFQLRRYARENGDVRRRQKPITLTRDIFRRLIDDLATIFTATDGEEAIPVTTQPFLLDR